MQPNGILDAVLLAEQTVEHQIPVSMSLVGGVMRRGSGRRAMRAVDYVLFTPTAKSPESVHESIEAMKQWTGYNRPVLSTKTE